MQDHAKDLFFSPKEIYLKTINNNGKLLLQVEAKKLFNN